jgi:predicted TIM-barrel fold metal-dependent hydrolase
VITGIDSHAHVFLRSLPLASGRRYSPQSDAGVEQYLAMLDVNGMSHGVLVQPSFLGRDNSYLLEALAVAPERLRGIVVVDPGISFEQMRVFARRGVVGIRLNLLGQPDPDFSGSIWRTHLGRLSDLDWQVEVQAEAGRLAKLAGQLLDAGVSVVVDHFGRPDTAADPGFCHLLDMAGTGRLWVKLSGVYRLGANGAEVAAQAVPLLRQALGLDHLIWGSDWPHTQFETVASPGAALAALEGWLPDPAERRTVLVDAPARLFGFR